MELAGLLVGAPGLASLLIKTSLQGYEVFSDIRGLDEDFRYYHTQFGLQEQILKDWGKRLEEFTAGRQLEEVLGSENERYQLIIKTAAEIAQLFANIDSMESDYGVRMEAQPTSSAAPPTPTLLLTPEGDNQERGRHKSFSIGRIFRRLSSRSRSNANDEKPTSKTVAKGTSSPASLSPLPAPFRAVISDEVVIEHVAALAAGYDRKISSYKQCKWAVSDKEKFGTLVRKLEKYNQGLAKITEPLFISPVEKTAKDGRSFDEFHLPVELPFPPNRLFCGREDLIDRIHTIFHPAKSATDVSSPTSTARQLIALHGLGGIGKTQIALEYAHRYEKFYSTILWVDAKDRTVLESSGVRILQQLVCHYATRSPSNPDYIRIASELGIPGGIDPSGTVKQETVNSSSVWHGVKHWLQKKGNTRWLLLVDNNDDLEAVNITNYLPTSNWGSIIVTSRRSDIRSLGHLLSVTEMEKDIGRLLLTKAVRGDREELTATEMQDAEEVVEKLGGLPLAISQAAAYIAKTHIDCKTYLRKLETNFKRIASTKPSVWTYGNDSVFTCWEISFEALCPSAAQVLHLCAFLSNEDIPDELFHRGRTGVEWLNNDDAFDIAIEDLLEYSLVKRKVTRQDKYDSFWVHPVVHQWARERVNEDGQRANAGEAISLITSAVVAQAAKRDPKYWQFERRISNHIDLYSRNISKYYNAAAKKYSGNLLRSMLTMGNINYFRGDLERSFECYQRALDGYENALGKDHPDTLTTVHNLASLFECRGEYDNAFEWYQRVLDGWEKALGKEHPDTLATVNQLASLFHSRGEYDKAFEWYQQVLDGREKALGKDHPDTLTIVNNLAVVFKSRGEYDKALEWYQRALDGEEKALGKDHPYTLATVDNLAQLYRSRGEYDKAFEWFQRALDGREKALGKDHPHTLTTVHQLAVLFESRGEYDKAFEWYQRVLDGREKALGKDHPDTLNTVHNLAGLFESRGEYDKAFEWYQRVLDGREKSLGKDHPDTLTTVHNLAGLFESRGEYDKAFEWYQRVLYGREKALGKDHPDTLTTVHNLAGLFKSRGEYDKAFEWYQRVLDGYEKALGKDHPHTLTTVHQLAGLFESRGEYDKAFEWYQRALDGKEKALGKDHPDTLTTVHNLAGLFESRGEYDQAFECYQRALDGREKALGKDHPWTISSANALARIRAPTISRQQSS